jgi:hypothetical protein
VFSNDVICLAMTPVVARLCLQRGLPPLPFLMGLACAANIGSAATLIGNPQNMLIGSVLKLDFAPTCAMPAAGGAEPGPAVAVAGPWPGRAAAGRRAAGRRCGPAVAAPATRRRTAFRRLADRQGPARGHGADGWSSSSPTGRATWPRWWARPCCCSAAACIRRT